MNIKPIRKLSRSYRQLSKPVRLTILGGTTALLVTGITLGSVLPFQNEVRLRGAASDEYLIRFPDGTMADYVTQLQSDVKTKLDEYQKENPGFTQLDLKYVTLRSTLTPEREAYYYELEKAIAGVDPRLRFELQPRTTANLNAGYYQKNNPMVNFLWAPDYNNVATWLAYAFQEQYQVPNMWIPTYKAIANPASGPYSSQPWVQSLYDHFYKSENGGPITIVLTTSDKANPTYEMNLATDPAELSKLATQYKFAVDDYYAQLQGSIGAWVNENSQDINSHGPRFVGWINSFNSNLPHYENGPETENYRVVRENHVFPVNSNKDPSPDDYYSTNSDIKTAKLSWTNKVVSDDSYNIYNPAFIDATNSAFFQSTFATLFNWTINGPSTTDPSTQPGSKLVATGSAESLNDLKAKDFTADSDPKKGYYLDVNIRAIPWMDINNQPTDNKFLSPQDFSAGLKAYEKSSDIGFNANGYFIGMIGLNVENTLAHPGNNERNEAGQSKPYRLYFDKPLLDVGTVMDIFSKQYFAALPAYKESVQNIIDDTKSKEFIKLTKNPDGSEVIDSAKTNFNALYGFGNTSNFATQSKDWVSAGPYTMTGLTANSIDFSLNSGWFDAVETSAVASPYEYQGLRKYEVVNGDPRYKFEKVSYTWGDERGEAAILEDFAAGNPDSVDMAIVPQASISEWQQNKLWDPYLTQKTTQADIMPYNLLVYQQDSVTKSYLDGSGLPLNVTQTYDQYGNSVLKDASGNSVDPLIKAGGRVSQAYADLMVDDFYTPYIPGRPDISGTSATIRTALNDLINWYTLSSVMLGPKNKPSYMQSITPFGVYGMENTITGEPNSGTFWSYAADRKTTAPFNMNDPSRNYGIVPWTRDELKNAL